MNEASPAFIDIELPYDFPPNASNKWRTPSINGFYQSVYVDPSTELWRGTTFQADFDGMIVFSAAPNFSIHMMFFSGKMVTAKYMQGDQIVRKEVWHKGKCVRDMSWERLSPSEVVQEHLAQIREESYD